MKSGSASIGIDLEAKCRSIVRLRAVIPENAFTAGILGTERLGSGVVINGDGLILTVGYLITEATDVWLTTHRGEEVAGHPLAFDQVTGFGLVLPLKKLDVAPLPFGSSARLAARSKAYVLSYREFAKPQSVQVLARREFAGAWEYLLESAIFTAPAHPHWSGSALIDQSGDLVGLGSLLIIALTGCFGYVDGGGGGVVVAGPEVGFFGGPYERGPDVHAYSARGAASRGVAHGGGGAARGGGGGGKR